MNDDIKQDQKAMGKILRIAKVCHEANKAYCEGIGDLSQVNWESAPEWQKQSAINGVIFHISTPDALASASHDSWMEEKVKAGWIYGEVKDPEKKTHPCIVPFDELPADQQAKDHLFKAIITALS